VIDVRHEQAVAASPAAVWAVLARFDRVAEWAAAVDHSSSLTETRAGLGATRRIQAGSMVLIEEITGWEPEVRLAYALRGLPPLVRRAVNEWTIEPDGAAARVALTAHIVAGPRPPMRIAARVLARRIGATNAGLLADLVRTVEGATL
jgi:Polyketide cyclase / dehydrase and lipid transport